MARDDFGKLRARAERALGGQAVTEAVMKVRAIIGPADIPASEPMAQAAMDKMRNGEVPTAEELQALEIVIRLLRPVVFSRNGGVLDPLPHAKGHNLYTDEQKAEWNGFSHRVAQY